MFGKIIAGVTKVFIKWYGFFLICIFAVDVESPIPCCFKFSDILVIIAEYACRVCIRLGRFLSLYLCIYVAVVFKGLTNDTKFHLATIHHPLKLGLMTRCWCMVSLRVPQTQFVRLDSHFTTTHVAPFVFPFISLSAFPQWVLVKAIIDDF